MIDIKLHFFPPKTYYVKKKRIAMSLLLHTFYIRVDVLFFTRKRDSVANRLPMVELSVLLLFYLHD